MKKFMGVSMVMGLLLALTGWMMGCQGKTENSGDCCGLDGDDGEDTAPPRRYSKSYTTSEDFKQGILVGVNTSSQPNQLQMNSSRAVFETPYIWIPNSADRLFELPDGTKKGVDTVTQIDTRTNPPVVVGTFDLIKDGVKCVDPSRTTVDKNLDVWIACRGSGHVIKVAHEGPADKRVLLLVPLQVDKQLWPRGVAIDADDHLWVGCGDSDLNGSVVDLNDKDSLYKLDEITGECLMGDRPECKAKPLQIADWPYGAAVDQKGFLWQVSNHHWTNGTLTKINTKTDVIVGEFKAAVPETDLGCNYKYFYGLAIDQFGDVWVANYPCSAVLKFDGDTGQQIGRYSAGGSGSRGLAVDRDGNVWVALSLTTPGIASRLNGQTGAVMNSITVGKNPIGVGVDAYGMIWVVNQGDNNVIRILETSPNVFATQVVDVGFGPYTYSDMLGTVLRTITLSADHPGYWDVIYDTGILHPVWRDIRWTSLEPDQSNVRVRMRCGTDQTDLATKPWGEYLEEPGKITCDSKQWIQVQAEFIPSPSGSTPVLKDLAISWED